ncbi:MAG: 30S ribosomal protein S18 [Bdellovibrionales bacterium]|nr:30S ribosomal protein S18 [Bdellovibrionales bacterium]
MDRAEKSDRSDNKRGNANASSGRSKYRTEYNGDYKFDYKDPATLYRFIGEGGKIVPSRISKLSMCQQRDLTNAIKKARNLALLPVGSLSYDDFSRPQNVSPVPFSFE